jgi:hypothetical protein
MLKRSLVRFARKTLRRARSSANFRAITFIIKAALIAGSGIPKLPALYGKSPGIISKTKLTNCSRINLQKYFAEQDERALNSRDLINDITLTRSISAEEGIASPLQSRFRRLSHSIDIHLVENAETEEPNATQRIHAYFSEYGRSAQRTSGRRIRRLAGMILPHWRSGTNDMPATVNPRESPEPRSTSPGNQNLIFESPPAAHLSGDHRVVL